MPEIFHPYASFGHQSRMPMRFEADVFECEVEGEIPKELEGAYYRTGADRQFPSLENDIILNGDGLPPRYQPSCVCSSNGRVSAGGGVWRGRIGSVRSPFHGIWSAWVQALTWSR